MLGRRDRGDIVNGPESLILLFFLCLSRHIEFFQHTFRNEISNSPNQ
jgi:hypothetical protein